VCVGCVHEPDPDGSHYYYLADTINFTRPDGTVGSAIWLLLCDACFIKHGESLRDDLLQSKVKIACDMVWPDDLQVTFTTS